jgi:hypothetical protein
MVQRSMRLITVIRAQLRKDRVGNLIESQFEDLGVNPLDEAVRVNIDFAEIEVSLEESNKPILEEDVKDEEVDILGRQG